MDADFKNHIEMTLKELTHEDIVDMLSSTFYGSDYMAIRYNRKVWEHLPEDKRTPNPCCEDICADLLLNGKTIQLVDIYADDEEAKSKIRNGRFVDFEEYGKCWKYNIRLKDFFDAAKTPDGAEMYKTFADGEDDLWTSEGLLQAILYGEIIYG